MAVDIDHQIVQCAARTDYVVTRRDLVGAGISHSSVSRRVGGILTPVASGVYVVGATSPNRLLRASLRAVDGSAVADESAANLHDLPVRDRHLLAVVSPKGHSAAVPEPVRLRQTRHLPPEDVAIVVGLRTRAHRRAVVP